MRARCAATAKHCAESGTDPAVHRSLSRPSGHCAMRSARRRLLDRRFAMKAWMATAAALTLLAGISAANAQSAPARTNNESDKTMEQSATPKADASNGNARHAREKTHAAGHKASM